MWHLYECTQLVRMLGVWLSRLYALIKVKKNWLISIIKLLIIKIKVEIYPRTSIIDFSDIIMCPFQAYYS